MTIFKHRKSDFQDIPQDSNFTGWETLQKLWEDIVFGGNCLVGTICKDRHFPRSVKLSLHGKCIHGSLMGTLAVSSGPSWAFLATLEISLQLLLGGFLLCLTTQKIEVPPNHSSILLHIMIQVIPSTAARSIQKGAHISVSGFRSRQSWLVCLLLLVLYRCAIPCHGEMFL